MKIAPKNKFKLDPEFQSLLPPLTPDERTVLEDSLRRNGCLCPLVIWKETQLLLDGYRRWEICQRVGIPVKVIEISLKDRDTASLWIISHQLGKRNLNPFQRIEVVSKLEPLIAAQAKENLKSPTGGKSGSTLQKLGKSPVNTEREMAELAQVSHETYRKAKYVIENSSEQVKEELRRGFGSIHHAYLLTVPKSPPETDKAVLDPSYKNLADRRSTKEPNDGNSQSRKRNRNHSKEHPNNAKENFVDIDPIAKARIQIEDLALGFYNDGTNVVGNFMAEVHEIDNLDLALRGFVEQAKNHPSLVTQFIQTLKEAVSLFGKNEATYWLESLVKLIEQQMASPNQAQT